MSNNQTNRAPQAAWIPDPLESIENCLQGSMKRAVAALRDTGHTGDAIDASRVEYVRLRLPNMLATERMELAGWQVRQYFEGEAPGWSKWRDVDAESAQLYSSRNGYETRCLFAGVASGSVPVDAVAQAAEIVAWFKDVANAKPSAVNGYKLKLWAELEFKLISALSAMNAVEFSDPGRPYDTAMVERIALQLGWSPPGFSLLQADDLEALRVYAEATEDGRDHNVAGDRMLRLADLGVVKDCGFEVYEITGFGTYVAQVELGIPTTLPLRTLADIQAAASEKR